MNNLFKNMLKKPVREDVRSEPVQKGPDRQTRQKQMRAQLESIDLQDPGNRLSQEIIQHLNISGVIRFVCSRLSDDQNTGPDVPALDKNIDYIIHLLIDAIQKGFELTAEWACAALVRSVKELRTDIPEVDKEYAQALTDCRVDYSEKLKLMVALYRECDYLHTELEEQERRQKHFQADLDQRRADLESRQNSDSPDTQLLQAEHDALRSLEESLAKLNDHIEASRALLTKRQAQIETCHNLLTSVPHICDPSLLDRFTDASSRYRQQLHRKLDIADDAARSYKLHVQALTDLANSKAHPEAPIVPTKKQPAPTAAEGPDRQTRQQQMRTRLESIDLKDPANMLSGETIQNLDIPGVIRFACGRLSDDKDAAPDSPELDANITYFIDALADAVRQDFATTAEWACTALFHAFKILRTAIPETQRGSAPELTARRVAYAEDLKLMIELAREHDHASRTLADLNRRRKQKQEELDCLKSSYLDRNEAGILDGPKAELEANIHNPTKLSDEARALRNELVTMGNLKESLVEIDTHMDAEQLLLIQIDCRIGYLRSALANPPHVGSPRLPEHVDASEQRYVQQLLSAAKSDDRNELLAENVLLQKQVEDLRAQLETSQSQVQDLQNQTQDLQDQVQDAQKEAAIFRYQVGARQSRIRELEQKVNSLENQQRRKPGPDEDEASTIRRMQEFHGHPEKMSYELLADIADL